MVAHWQMRPIILWEEFQCNCFSLTQLFLLVTSSTTYTFPRKSAGMAARGFGLQDLPDHPAATRFSTAITPDRNPEVQTHKKRFILRTQGKRAFKVTAEGFISLLWINDKLSPLGIHRKEGCWLRSGCLHWARFNTASNFTGEVSRQS